MNKRFRFPRTYHLNFSQSLGSDDKILKQDVIQNLVGKPIVATIKYDGESTTLYNDGNHARSIDSTTNWTRDYMQKKWSEISYLIPDNFRVCCENLYAKHSIYYPEGYLDDYLYLLAVFDDNNICLSWEETKEWATKLSLPTPKVIYDGVFELKTLEKLSKQINPDIEEGFVFRLQNPFHYDDYSSSVGKYVRKNHVATDEHWLKNATPNGKPKNHLKKKLLDF